MGIWEDLMEMLYGCGMGFPSGFMDVWDEKIGFPQYKKGLKIPMVIFFLFSPPPRRKFYITNTSRYPMKFHQITTFSLLKQSLSQVNSQVSPVKPQLSRVKSTCSILDSPFPEWNQHFSYVFSFGLGRIHHASLLVTSNGARAEAKNLEMVEG